jgi:site-specific recombinase XerD
MNLKEAIFSFYSYLSSNNHSPSTANLYKSILEKIPRQNFPIQKITPTDLQRFLDKKRKLSPSSRNVCKSAVRSFCRWATEMDLIDKDPSRLLKLEKIPQREAAYLMEEEIKKFLDSIKGQGREELIFHFYLSTACRLNEIRKLNCGDVKNKSSIMVCGKGRRTREVFLSESLQKMIANHIEGKKDREPLFKSALGNHLSSGQITYNFRRYLALAGIQGRFSIHSIRHTALTLLFNSTKNLRLVQEIAGHSSPAMTARYAHIGREDKRKAIENLFKGGENDGQMVRPS